MGIDEPDVARGTVDDSVTPEAASLRRDEIRPPRTVARDDYVWGAEIGRGGMGVVSMAFDRSLGRQVAIKELLPKHTASRRRFEREMRLTARLQHPGIVPIYEAGRWPTDEPFYAMKMVSGETLESAVAARTTLTARLGLLGNVLAVAEAVAYAHKQSIIHRDLKPANVILGAYGETVVIDWGLGKDLSEPERDDVVPDESDSGDALTVAGSAVGTPAYMAPEQARGETVDERADVYALGAMLYHVLAGERPYTGISGSSLLEHIRIHPPVALATVVPEIPADLGTVVERAMHRDPAKRYASARELADDLKRFEDGQRVAVHTYSVATLIGRWVRRYRTSVMVALALVVALVIAVIVGVTRVVDERDRARRERGAAEELVQFMLGDMQRRLEPVGKLDLLYDVGDKVDRYYAALDSSTDSAPQMRRAQALDLLGKIDLKRGDLDAADRALSSAEATARPLGNDSLVSTILGDRGDLEYARGHKDLARTANQQSLALAERLAAADPTDRDVQRRLAHELRNIGELDQAAGNLDAALRDYQRSLAAEQAVDGTTPDRYGKQLLCATYEKVGEVSHQRGELDATLANYRACLAIAKTILDRDPGDEEFLQRAAESELLIGEVATQRLDYPTALAQFRRSLELAETMARRDPSNRHTQFEIAETLALLSHAELETHDVANATAHAQRRCTIAEELHHTTPADVTWARGLEACREQLGEIALAKPDAAAARASFAAALAIGDELRAAEPTNMSAVRDVELMHMKLGDTALLVHDHATSATEYRAALALAEQLVAKDPHNSTWVDDVSWDHESIGDVLLATNDARGALVEFQHSLEPRLHQAEAEPSNMQWKTEISESYGRIAKAQLALHDRAGATAALRSLLAIEATTKRDASDDAGAAALAEARLELAEIVAAEPNGRDEARTLVDQAIPVLDKAATTDKSVLPRVTDAKALRRRL